MLMDSGNSSSMQSNSSGGDDQEYDSTSFFHNTPPPPQTLFTPADPNFLQPFSDFINWPNSGSDDPNYTYFPAAGAGASTSAAALPPPPPPPKNPKKRTRASRRAPTTVLTTDTSNFRAMVQEFTGIPAPPFAAAATSAYSRLLGGQFRPAAQRQLPSQSNYDIFSSSLLNMGGQQTGLPGLPGQPGPFFDFHSLLQQQHHQPQQSNSSQLLGNAALEINIGDGGGNNNINSNTNDK